MLFPPTDGRRLTLYKQTGTRHGTAYSYWYICWQDDEHRARSLYLGRDLPEPLWEAYQALRVADGALQAMLHSFSEVYQKEAENDAKLTQFTLDGYEVIDVQ